MRSGAPARAPHGTALCPSGWHGHKAPRLAPAPEVVGGSRALPHVSAPRFSPWHWAEAKRSFGRGLWQEGGCEYLNHLREDRDEQLPWHRWELRACWPLAPGKALVAAPCHPSRNCSSAGGAHCGLCSVDCCGQDPAFIHTCVPTGSGGDEI